MAVQTDVAREFLLFRLFSCTTAKKRASRAGGRGTGSLLHARHAKRFRSPPFFSLGGGGGDLVFF